MIHAKTTKANFPLLTLLSILFITLTLLLGLFCQTWFTYRDSRRIEDHDFQIQALTGTITYLDEVLTMSARMGAVTGDQKWESRYLSFEPKLHAAIKDARRLSSEAFLIKAADQTNAANIKLVAMEKRAFDLVRNGQKDAAVTLLFSEEYESQKIVYSEGIKQITVAMQACVEKTLNKHHRLIFIVSAR